MAVRIGSRAREASKTGSKTDFILGLTMAWDISGRGWIANAWWLSTVPTGRVRAI